MRKRSIVLLIIAGSVSTAAMVAWLYRASIVTSFVDDALQQRGVRATYDVEQVGLGRQRLRNIVIGDAANPDLTIAQLDLWLALDLSGARIAAVSADGVRMRGAWRDGRLQFGDVEKLLPPDDGTPFELPDMRVSLRRAALQLETPWGLVGVGASGAGHLTQRFAGQLAVRAPQLSAGDCEIDTALAGLRVSIVDREPNFVGPVGAERVRCDDAGVAVDDVRIGLDGHLAPALDRVALTSRIRSGRASAGAGQVVSLAGTATMDGLATGAGRMSWELRGAQPSSAWAAARDVVIAGGGRRDANGFMSIDGDVRASDVRGGAALRDAALSLRDVGAGNPLQPILAKLSDAVLRAGDGASVTARYGVQGAGAEGLRATVGDVRADARSGAFLHFDGPQVAAFDSAGAVRLSLNGRFGGGDLPLGRVRAASAGRRGALTGRIDLEPYAADDGRLALSPVRFASDTSGRIRFETAALISGPLGDGRIDGLSLALAGDVDPSGSVALSGRCQTVQWAALTVGNAVLDRGRVPMCGRGGGPLLRYGAGGLSGGVTTGPVEINGRVGESPLSMRVGSGSFDMASGAMDLSNGEFALGAGAATTRLDVAQLNGRRDDAGFAGTLIGSNGAIANVPFVFSDITGQWRWAGDALTLTSALTVSDAERDARFEPLRSDDVAISYSDGSINVRGVLLEPRSRTRIASVGIVHNLANVAGRADFTVDGITFSPAGLQPINLSSLSRGVIANTTGSVRGAGRVDWADGAVTSTGNFTTDGLDFAAAFGPVTGMAGTIRFSDLIGLETPPGQVVTIATANPGIEVTDGRILYQLLPDQQVRVESGTWPLAGGQLLLRPTVLDFGIDRARNLTFDVVGVDAALFLTRFEFENINATGVFDGTIPTVFDAEGGRIIGGNLRSRAGGTLSYVGELTYQDLGYFGDLAFGALRSVRYDQLTIGLDGRIDGDMVTSVNFAGLAQGEGVRNNILTRAIRRLPVVFRIDINAPFNSLLGSLRGIFDPRLLIEQNLPALVREQREAERRSASAAEPADGAPPPPAVQPVVSDNRE